ncbi:MAG: sigma-70 family RNA polymerase sigma factor, partial [Oscillospiraceae bacterium]|nr:sigma-70 family RNA polymerase sigma factor [Oscillospiraceae bacterium]
MPSVQEFEKNLSKIQKTQKIQKDPAIQMSGTAFQIVDQYQDMIYRTALTLVGNAEDAEDILQEVFFKYFRLHPAFESESHEKAWFLRVTINEGKNLLKSFWKRRRTDFDFEKIPQPESHDLNHDSEVLQAVLTLPEKYRIAIYLHYYEEYS